ncbi:MAG: hypothetical protein WBH52_01940 [Pseudomonas aeruginosa]
MQVGRLLLGIVACVLLPVAAIGLMFLGSYVFANAASMIGTALSVAVVAGYCLRERLPSQWILKPSLTVLLAISSVVILVSGVLEKQRADAAKLAAKAAQERKVVAEYEARAQLFHSETQLVRNQALRYKGSSRHSAVGDQECRDSIRKAESISPNRHDPAFRAWYHAWYMCATYAGDFNKFPPLGEYVKTRPNLKDLLG